MSRARFQPKGKGAKAASSTPKAAVVLPSTPQELEAVLAALLAPDTAVITAATVTIHAFLNVPAAVPALLQQVAHSTVPEARQMAAVLMRKVIVKLWKNLKPNDQTEVVSAHASNMNSNSAGSESARALTRHAMPRDEPPRRARTACGLSLHCAIVPYSPAFLLSPRNLSSSTVCSRSQLDSFVTVSVR
jgi:hypothetical protein